MCGCFPACSRIMVQRIQRHILEGSRVDAEETVLNTQYLV